MMTRSMKWVIVGVVVVALAVAAGLVISGALKKSRVAPATTTGMSPAPTYPTAQPTPVAGIGDTLLVTGNVSKLEVTLLKTKRVAPTVSYGTEFSPAAFGVLLIIKNMGQAVYDDVIGGSVLLIDTKDQTHDVGAVMVDKHGVTLEGQLQWVKIAPGDKRRGWVYFAMKPSQKARTLQFMSDSGYGPEVGEWSLR